ncbi:MAG: hypothetical protein ACI8WL_000839 [Polaribacter sp.]|jgi:hypothetical protein|tara:strand:- start:8 stop:856 length:849 start_codon:yes stop_codon:yes gene_type:complete
MNAKVITIGQQSFEIRQTIKWLVYTLVIINFGFYIRNDLVIAGHTLYSGSSLLEISRAFATTIDESAWIILLLLFELETYLLSDDPLSRAKTLLMQGIRLVCYISLAHTLYAYGVYLAEIYAAVPVEEVTNLCQLIGKDLSYASNLVYSEINSSNCASLSSANQFFYVDPPTFFIVEDAAGLAIEKQLAWIDIFEAIIWLLILLSIEVAVWLQDRNIGQGLIFKTLSITKWCLYSLLWAAAGYWIYRGHYMFAWDEFVWIAGFVAIEMNIVEWRNEINDAEV